MKIMLKAYQAVKCDQGDASMSDFWEHDQCTLRIIQSRAASTEVTNDNNSYSSSKMITFEKYKSKMITFEKYN